MSPALHSHDVLAEFLNGETRLVYAHSSLSTDGRPFFLADGEAAAAKTSGASFSCLIPDCPAPRMSVVARTRGRDGFRHQAGAGGHAPESLFHIQAKAMIAAWARSTYPSVTVTDEQTVAGGARRADLLVTGSGGAQVVVEIQYSALTGPAWTERHQSYADAGIKDVWLLGHTRALAPRPAPHDQVELPALADTMIAAGVQPLWVNPISGTIGTAWTHEPAYFAVDGKTWSERPRPGFCLPAQQGARRLHRFDVVDLGQCALEPSGMTTPTLLRALDGGAEKDAHDRVEQAKHNAMKAKRKAMKAESEQRRLAEHERVNARTAEYARAQAAAAAEVEQRRAETERRLLEAAAAAGTDAERTRLGWLSLRHADPRRARPEQVPGVLLVSTADERAWQVDPIQWRTALCWGLLGDLDVNERVLASAALDVLRQAGFRAGREFSEWRSIVQFFNALSAAHLVGLIPISNTDHGLAKVRLKVAVKYWTGTVVEP